MLFKERIKSTIIIILIFNLLFLTTRMWFYNSGSTLKNTFVEYVRTIPVLENFFPIEEEYSISKENLSKPRKFLINDGSLWMAYYNTDIGFSPINERTKLLLGGFLNGDITATKKIDSATWEAGLESLGIYIEYPVAFSPEMFSKIMGANENSTPKEIGAFREFIVIPSTSDSDVCVLARDNKAPDNMYAYILSDEYTLPASDLEVYTSADYSYYQPAFSTGLELAEGSNVSLDPLVLFSDSQPTTKVLSPVSLIKDNTQAMLLENFGFNAEMKPYEDSDGAIKYIGNYSNATIYPDGIFEYSVLSDEQGILLDGSANSYNVLNASIDFSEQVWKAVSSDQLSILISSDLSGYNSSIPYTFKFDYYCNGRPVKIDLPANYGHDKMNCAIEITVKDGRLISYRQYMRNYISVNDYVLSDNFVTALDYFVQTLEENVNTDVIIKDIYIGYTDTGLSTDLYATWLAQTDSDAIYRYTSPVTDTTTE